MLPFSVLDPVNGDLMTGLEDCCSNCHLQFANMVIMSRLNRLCYKRLWKLNVF